MYQANRLKCGDSALAPRVHLRFPMTTRIILLLAGVLSLSVGLLAAGGAQAQDVSVNVNAGAPPPPMVFVTPPRLVVVPGSAVMYAPNAAFNVFVFRGRYFSFHNGAWFHSASHKGPWVLVPMDKVPLAVRAVPVGYYKIPPGQARKMAKGEDWSGKGPKGR